ncbi:glycosyltransferase [Paludibacter sp.]|uniref:glycosyltransferase family 2 protein n=1 Tax=Paludibacter sp. TaxID=1898105 RepID=UPI0013558A8B|nr:glycosyltransferase [Paludibacter sp.]MTK52834.1 glycosyltransferase family 2 protein [Paludibacter sp.]
MADIFFNNLFLVIAALIMAIYLFLGIISMFQLIEYKRANRYTDFSTLLSSPLAPGVTVIAPAYNESKTIVNNIKALFTLQYNNYEIIVVNDGSTDDTLDKIIKEFDLIETEYIAYAALPTQPVNGIYKSRNQAYSFLTVVDKQNGGKADALNAGINVSHFPYFVAIDVDCIVVPDALQKLVKPFLSHTDNKTIATGGVIRIANSCKIDNGQVLQVNVPDEYIVRFQVVEYLRAFLMGRMAWSKLNGLLIISGALGMFDKDIVVQCGGYNVNTVGEDMELVVRMRRFLYDQKIKHRVEYIPDPLCWTEVPTTQDALQRQRNRWTRGNIDTLKIHRKLLFNPKYGRLGMLGYPFWFFFEWLAPLFEAGGYVFMLFLLMTSIINWPIFLFLLLFVYLFSVSFSFYAVLFDEFTFHRYHRFAHLRKLFIIPFIEPIVYHPLNVYWAIRGNISFLKGNRKWDKLERKGFSNASPQ